VEEKELEQGKLTESVAGLLTDPHGVKRMEQAIAAFADPKANQHIWEEIQKAVSGSR
jgi:UDP-N-acetylglucosamine:LPS N-acetylglucosamine transferase